MIDKLLERTSCRNFLDKPLSSEIINKLKQVINSSPTAINAQPFSAIFITNKNTKNELVKYNFNQLHISQAPLIVIFFSDFNRITNNLTNEYAFTKYTDSVIDATIACSLLMIAANDLDLGTCILGGFRKWPKEVNNLLNATGKCVPTIGLALGYPSKQGMKVPKINKCYDEQYNLKKIMDEVCTYDETIKSFYKSVLDKEISWKDMVSKNLNKLSPNNSENEIKKIFDIK